MAKTHRVVEEEKVFGNHRLQEQARWLKTVLNSIGEGLITINLQGQVTFMNPVAESLTGWPQEEALGQELASVVKLVAEDTGQPLPNPGLEALQTDQPVVLEQQALLVARDGTTRPIDNTASPIEDPPGSLAGAVVIFKDVTERRQVEIEREKLIEELDSFAQTVAHDLRSPLGTVLGFAEQLQSPDLVENEQVRFYLKYMAQSAHKMDNIVQELLVLTGVRKQEVEAEALDISRTVRDACHRLTDMIEKYQAQLIVPDEWPAALGYGPWIEEVWVNYIGNAIKYGGQPPVITLGATEQEGMVCFWVQDNGLGLSLEEQEQLFTPFVRLNRIKVDGHGLGLSIVRHIVEKLGGTVGVTSSAQPGQGCTFSFTLPTA